MSGNKTVPSGASVEDVLAAAPPARAQDALRLDELFRRATGFTPKIRGGSIAGYGRCHYRYASGREGDFLATGFSPRKAAFSICIMPGYQDYGAILARLGKHRTGKSCLYVNKLADVDLAAPEELIRQGLKDLHSIWPVEPE